MFNLQKASFRSVDLGRRGALAKLGGVTLSAAAIALMGGCESMANENAADADAMAQDVTILNTALGAELEAVAAYQVGAESGLLTQPSLDLAVQFQDHHKQHADALAATVAKMGGSAAGPLADYGFPVEQLNSEADVLQFAAGLEKGAVAAYLGAVPLFGDRALAQVAASILGDEAMHWAVLRFALGENPVPAAFVS